MDKELKFLDKLFKLLDSNYFFSDIYDFNTYKLCDYIKRYIKWKTLPIYDKRIKKRIEKLIKEYKEEKENENN